MDSSAKALFLGEEELLPFMRERLAAGQKLRYLPFRGVSMLPMLRQRKDTVEIAPLPERLERYDLPVYQYPSGKVVMHRVVRVEEDCYICRGDNTYADERITHDMMIAKVTAFKRGSKRIEVTNLLYQAYVHVWVAIYPLRRAVVPVKRKMVRFLRKLGVRRFWR